MTGLMNLTNKKFHKAPQKPFAKRAAWFSCREKFYNDSFLSVYSIS